MNPSTITIVSGFPLYTNPRAVKEADALSTAGYKVTVLTAHLGSEEDIPGTQEQRNWDAIYLVDNRRQGVSAKFRWFLLRARRKLFNLFYRITGISNIRQLGYCTPELIKYCLDHPADHYSLHLESSLAVGGRLAKLDRSYSVDFGDWYSRDLSGDQLRERPVALIEGLERASLTGASFASAASDSMASAISNHFGKQGIVTLYNTFSISQLSTMTPTRDTGGIRICWFSQTVGPYRGLEELLEALAGSDMKIELHLIGQVSLPYRQHLEAQFDHLKFHGRISSDNLVSYISQFDLGYAGETAVNVNRDLTVTNKLFQYLLAGLPVVASSTTGQREIADQLPGAVHLFSDKASLLEILSHFSDSGNRLLASQQALEAARSRFNWELESEKLIDQVRHVIR